MQLIHLTYQTSQLSLAHLKRAQDTYISLQLGEKRLTQCIFCRMSITSSGVKTWGQKNTRNKQGPYSQETYPLLTKREAFFQYTNKQSKAFHTQRYTHTRLVISSKTPLQTSLIFKIQSLEIYCVCRSHRTRRAHVQLTWEEVKIIVIPRDCSSAYG